jgi:hypothetical protein
MIRVVLFIDSGHFIYWLLPFYLLISVILFVDSSHSINCLDRCCSLTRVMWFIHLNSITWRAILFIDSSYSIYWFSLFYLLTRVILFLHLNSIYWLLRVISYIDWSHSIHWIESVKLQRKPSEKQCWVADMIISYSHIIYVAQVHWWANPRCFNGALLGWECYENILVDYDYFTLKVLIK